MKIRFFSSILAASLLLLPILAVAEGYRTTVGEGPDEIPLIVVKGTPYEMGFAFGSLMKEETQKVLGGFLQLARMGDPERFSEEILDSAWESVSPHTHEGFKEELRGIAEGAGLELQDVIRAHMVPVVADYSCSGVALWGERVANGHLLQIRNLDYETEAGLQDYPAVVLYIPNEGIPHVSPTFAGCAGSNTGMNAEGIALTEIGDTPASDWPFNLDGVHFTSLFRDILANQKTLDGAVSAIVDSPRIKKYHYVVGSGQERKGVKIKAHAPDIKVWADNDPTDERAPKLLTDGVYHCESRDPLAWKHFPKHSPYTAESMVDLSRTVATKGGNLLNVVYDATALELWVAYAEKDENAYLRPYVHIKMSDYLPYSPKENSVQVSRAGN